MSVNPVSKLDCYPIPRLEDLFATLSGGESFSKIDLSQAYNQVLLDEYSKQYTVINTHKGFFHYNRLPFGINSAPGIFQGVMESLLQGMDGVIVYIDDILVTGKTRTEHIKTLDEVLARSGKAGLHLNMGKMRISCTLSILFSVFVLIRKDFIHYQKSKGHSRCP